MSPNNTVAKFEDVGVECALIRKGVMYIVAYKGVDYLDLVRESDGERVPHILAREFDLEGYEYVESIDWGEFKNRMKNIHTFMELSSNVGEEGQSE